MAQSTGLLSPLREAAFAKLFAARTIALVGSGLTTVALSLLAYDLAGGRAGVVLGVALALKMVAYVTVAPVVGGLGAALPRRALLVGLDLARAVLVGLLVFVSSIGEIYAVIFLLSACSAGFTPVYQATLPELLRDAATYTRGLALSRVSYDLEGLLSPSLSTLALLVVGYPVFFTLNAAGFVLSAWLVAITPLPPSAPADRGEPLRQQLTFGIRAYLATPRLRGMLALCTGVAMAGAMVIVNTVVIVRDTLGGTSAQVALAFAASGAGSLLAALATPALLERLAIRNKMLAGASALPVALGVGAVSQTFPGLLAAWFLAGVGMGLVQTVTGRVIEASCRPSDRAAFFSAHFSLSHAAWLIAYPLAGLAGAWLGIAGAFALTATAAALAAVAGARLWPRHEPAELWHFHEPLEHAHAHEHDAHHEHTHADEPDAGDAPHAHRHRHGRTLHRHRFVIDAHHPRWPD